MRSNWPNNCSLQNHTRTKAKLLPIELLEDMTTGQDLRDFPAYRILHIYNRPCMETEKFFLAIFPGVLRSSLLVHSWIWPSLRIDWTLSLVTSVIQALAVAAWKKPTQSV
jgi:hypothetical protein